jgi:hypothetical protein
LRCRPSGISFLEETKPFKLKNLNKEMKMDEPNLKQLKQLYFEYRIGKKVNLFMSILLALVCGIISSMITIVYYKIISLDLSFGIVSVSILLGSVYLMIIGFLVAIILFLIFENLFKDYFNLKWYNRFMNGIKKTSQEALQSKKKHR